MRLSYFFSVPLATVIAASAAPVDFVSEVRPIFEQHCYECHGDKKQKGGLRLDVKSAALKGGDSHGPDIIPGKAKQSHLLQVVTSGDEDEVMPPKGTRLNATQVATLTAWIDQGAVWPDGVDAVKLKDTRDHWSFKPLRSSPDGSTQSPVPSIDGFIDTKLAENSLRRSPPADATTWLRRATFDLTGLPPTPEEVAAFVQKPDRAAALDRLLASPRYGERWGQHWLDVVRYADTYGFEVNTERPHAWPYRDYVIRAFNQDTPYDRFIKEQIVGDALGQDVATGFLVTASVLLPGQIGRDEASKRLARQDSLDEIVNNLGQTFLGLSVGCARCHDHKFDPITAKDYYAMQALVAGVEYMDREIRTPEADAARTRLKSVKAAIVAVDRQLAQLVPLAGAGAVRPMVSARENVERFKPVRTKKLRFTIRETNRLEPCVDEIEAFGADSENFARSATVTVSGERVTADTHEQRFVNDGNYGNARSWMSDENGKGWVLLDFRQEREIDRVVWGRDRQGKFTDRLATNYVIEVADAAGNWRTVAGSDDRAKFVPGSTTEAGFTTKGLGKEEAAQARRLLAEKNKLLADQRALDAEQKAFAGVFRKPDKINLLNRGDPEQPKEEVAPALLSVLGDKKLPTDAPEQARREALAGWIADPRNPLTARVMVNRIWQGHFGAGLVQTPSDFGNNGMKPTHPALLDWLAQEFVRAGWSVKHMHRLIMLSETYRQSSAVDAQAARLDADARLLWRFPSRRLDAETIRDAMLAVSGKLNPKMYGRGFDLFDKRGGLSGFKPIEESTPENRRRMIYAHKVRREPEAVFGAFDCPDAGQSTAVRTASTTPIQALNLFNSPFTLQRSADFAERVRTEAGADSAAQVRRAYQLALSRDPTAQELAEALPAVRTHGAAVLCRALFNCSEFLFQP
jgi:mono/diheme cytochrome c family protein